MKTNVGYLAVGITIGLALIFLGWQFVGTPHSLNGAVIDPAAQAPAFQLMDHNGQPFHLSEQQGKVVLIFFGYTNCPDVCPVTLSEFRQISQRLGARAKDVRFVFITVDPERDTVKKLAGYVPLFNPDFIGLTGSRAELEPVWDKYGVYQEQQETGSAAGYLVDHSSRTYVIDKQGNWRETFTFGTDVDLVYQDVEFLLQEK